ncbi:hypothetical protein Sru01_15960 [Sphaerisporangium rufum]|uniref:Uncharacterized protein n=1 Tax=Sphaerisporangium rufum TaxID=1381558 RepID=A0A919QYP8_9ACTN|nr:hypothetical protein [Sphaerisporangium rufum]GII76614.1 hypothetical protein Sru01_15960 [Sphaerisporangium rufum]
MGRNQRRALWWRLKPYLGDRGDAALDLELDMEEDPYGGPIPGGPPPAKELKRLRAEARRNGERDGGSGMYDEWSLAAGSRPPFLVTLEAMRNEAVAEEKVRELRDLQRLEDRIAVTRQDLQTCEERAARTRAELDQVAADERRLQEALGGVRAAAASDGAPRPEEPPHPAARWAEPTRSLRRQALVRAARWAVLALFAAVELPIQYATFIYFNEGPTMTWAFVLGTAAAMLIAPHLAGGWTKHMSVMGWRSPRLPAAATVLVAWLAGVGLLAHLRTSVLFAPGTDSETGAAIRSTADALGVGRVPVTILFTALLLLGGTVTFTFGFLGENPYAARLGDIQRQRRRLEKALAALEGRRKRDADLVSLAEQRTRRHGERWAARIAARGEPYEVCVADYLEAVAQRMRNPAFTESVGQWLQERARARQPAG